MTKPDTGGRAGEAGRTAHTPGPWSIDDTSGQDLVWADGAIVAHAVHPKNWPADARLIATAPDLVKALEPLAEIADGIAESVPDQFEILIKIDATPVGRCTVGQLRAARAALSAKDGR